MREDLEEEALLKFSVTEHGIGEGMTGFIYYSQRRISIIPHTQARQV